MFSTRRRWTGSSSTMRMNSDMNAPRDATSAVVLTFRSVSLQPLSSERQNQNRTSTLELLVSLCFRRSHETVPQSDASVESGTLVRLVGARRPLVLITPECSVPWATVSHDRSGRYEAGLAPDRSQRCAAARARANLVAIDDRKMR